MQIIHKIEKRKNRHFMKIKMHISESFGKDDKIYFKK